jgi:hypothetical protein
MGPLPMKWSTCNLFPLTQRATPYQHPKFEAEDCRGGGDGRSMNESDPIVIVVR